MTLPRCWKLELAVMITVAAMLMSVTPAHAELTSENVLETPPSQGQYNLQAADPDGFQPPKEDAPGSIPPTPAPAADVPSGQPYYKTPRFWLFVGVGVLGAVAVAWGGSQLFFEMRGGEPRSCNTDFVGCFGEGR